MSVCLHCAQDVIDPCTSPEDVKFCKNAVAEGQPRIGFTKTTMLPPKLVNPTFRKVYVMGSLRNPVVKEVGQRLRMDLDCEVFDDWQAAAPDADDAWKTYEEGRGNDYIKALGGYAAQQVFNFDIKHLNESTHGLLVLPAGRSAHMELGYLRGQNKKVIILLDGDYERWDVMYNFASLVTYNIDKVLEAIKA